MSYAGMPQPLKVSFFSSVQRLNGDDFSLADAAADLSDALDAYWPLYADKGLFSARLQYLYVRRDALDWLRQYIFDKTTFSEGGVQQSDTDAFKALADLRGDLDKDILVLEGQIRAGQAPEGGVMTTTRPAPEMPSTYPDPTAPYFRGLPFDPRIFGGS